MYSTALIKILIIFIKETNSFQLSSPTFVLNPSSKHYKKNYDASFKKTDSRNRHFFCLKASSGLKNTEGSTKAIGFSEEQLDFTKGYLNKHHSDVLKKICLVFSELGEVQVKKNRFSGGLHQIEHVQVEDFNLDSLSLLATVQIRGEKSKRMEPVKIYLDSDPIPSFEREYNTRPKVPVLENDDNFNFQNPMFLFARRLNRLCTIINEPGVTGKLIQLAIKLSKSSSVLELHENLFLNQVPHNRYVRKYFYEMASKATLQAVKDCSDKVLTNRMKVVCMFPELNPSMDSYRIGTLLELVRAMAITLAEQNLRVRVCVQQSLGVGIFTGTPKQLNGVATLLRRMDWESEEGEANEGMVGNYVNFGSIGKDQVMNKQYDHENDGEVVQEQDDVFIIIAPQSMVGVDASIMSYLEDMVDAAGDRPVILINPDLSDKQSSQGQQGVRGRKERMDFASSFETIYQFQNIYVSGTSYFPILGAMCKLGPRYPYVAYQRRDWINESGEKGEIYIPVVSSESKPAGDVILNSFEK